MTQILTYPTPPPLEYGVDVRVVDDEVLGVIGDLKETLQANNLEALSAFQIGSRLNIIVYKDSSGDLIELLNSRIIAHSGKIVSDEKTAYFPDISAKIERHKEITILYEDLDLNTRTLRASDDLAILLQRKIDYCYGSTFLHRLAKDEKKLFEKKLKFGSKVAISEVCPTTFRRDYILKAINITLLVTIATMIYGFLSGKNVMFSINSLLLFATLSNIIYFFFAYYEGKNYTSCTSCQIGNIIGVTFITFVKISLLYIVSYFIISP